MNIKTKILAAFLAMSVLVALMGALAVNRQHAAATAAATKEAEDVARVLSFILMEDSSKPSASAQKVVDRLHQAQGRDVVLMNTDKLVLADAIQSEVGETFHSPGDEAGATMKDRQVRTFVETGEAHPAGIKQIVVPIEGESGQVIGAVVLEYTPLYDELMRVTGDTILHLVLACFGSILISLLIAFYVGRSITKPLQQLTNMAAVFASGRTDFPLPLPRKDELGKLFVAFNDMVQKRQQAESRIRQMGEELEARVVARTAELAEANRALQTENVDRRQAEERLEGLRGEYRAILNSVGEGVHWVGADRRIKFENPAAAKMLGYEVPELIGKLSHPTIHHTRDGGGAYPDSECPIYATVSDGLLRRMKDEIFWRKDGTSFPVEYTSNPVRDEKGERAGAVVVFTDITERKRAEENLQRTQMLLRMAGRLARIGAWAIEVPSRKLEWSDEIYAILEVPLGDAPSLAMALNWYPLEWRTLITAAIERCAAEGIPFDMELEILTAKGRRIWVRAVGEAERDAVGIIRRVQGAFQDISERKAAEAETRELGGRLTSTLESLTDGFFTIGRDWRFTYLNREAEHIFKHSQAELIGSNLWDKFPEARGSLFQQEYERALRDNVPVQFETFYPPHNKWFDARAFPSAQGLAVYVRDITEQKRAEEELNRKTAFLEAQVNASIDGILVVDENGNRASLQNQRFIELLKIPQDIAEEKDDTNRLQWVTNRTIDPKKFVEKVRYLYAHPTEISRDEVELNDGTILDRYSSPVIGKDGKYYGRMWTFRDITARTQVENALRESNEKFQQLADNITDAFWIRSPDLREVQYSSPAFEHIWGRTAASLLANPHEWTDSIVPEDRERVRGAFAALTRDAPSLDLEYRIARPDGALRWVRVRGFQVRDAAGKLIRLTGIVTDITERKQAEAELGKTHRELLDASRKAGMAEVATGILHNVGNVLNSVNVASSCVADILRKSKSADLGKVAALMREHEQDLGGFMTVDPQGKHVVGYISQLAIQLNDERTAVLKELTGLQKNVEHIKDIVTMQQSFAKVSGVAELLTVADLVEDALKLNASGLVRHGIQIIKEFEDVPRITVEKHKLLQILVNLVRNAKDACDGSAGDGKRVVIRVSNGQDRVRIAVSDNGVGIPHENLTRIFAHGFTTKQHGHGFGLHSGVLAAQEMGGSLGVRSDGSGRGSTFTLDLPLKLEKKNVTRVMRRADQK